MDTIGNIILDPKYSESMHRKMIVNIDEKIYSTEIPFISLNDNKYTSTEKFPLWIDFNTESITISLLIGDETSLLEIKYSSIDSAKIENNNSLLLMDIRDKSMIIKIGINPNSTRNISKYLPILVKKSLTIDPIFIDPTVNSINTNPTANSITDPTAKFINTTPIVKSINTTPIVKSINTKPIVKSINTKPIVKSINTKMESINTTPIVKSINTKPIVKSINTKAIVKSINTKMEEDKEESQVIRKFKNKISKFTLKFHKKIIKNRTNHIKKMFNSFINNSSPISSMKPKFPKRPKIKKYQYNNFTKSSEEFLYQ